VNLVPLVVTVVLPVKVPVGDEPMSAPAEPETVVAPVFVMPLPASTAQLEVDPKPTATGPADAAVEIVRDSAVIEAIAKVAEAILDFLKFNIWFPTLGRLCVDPIVLTLR